jgi:hypothetical protein
MFERRRIKHIAENKLERGISKQEILEELQGEFGIELVSRVLHYLPTRDSRSRFGKFNSFLLIGLIVLFLSDIIMIDFYSFPLILIDLILIILVASFQLRWYWLFSFRVFGAIGILVIQHYGVSLKNSSGFYFFMLIMSLIIFLYAMFFARKLAGNGVY